jgi:hypothetical protein
MSPSHDVHRNVAGRRQAFRERAVAMTTSSLHSKRTASPAPAHSFFVYLNSGEVRNVGLATSMHLTEDEVVILNGETRVTGFPRSDVYFCSGELVAPPCLT